MKKLPISLTVLTWKAPKTLEASLTSIRDLLPHFSELILVCQESDPREIDLGEKFGFKTIPLRTNVGIQYGMKACFDNATNEQVLFYENDLVLRASIAQALENLSFGSDALLHNEASFVKYRYLPDNKNNRSKLFDSYWKISNTRLKKKLPAYFRPKKSLSVLSKSVEYLMDMGITPPYFEKVNETFLLSDTSINAWENRAVLTTKSFFYKLLAFAESNPTKRAVNGSPDLEHPINCKQNRSWFQSLQAKLLIATPGLFGHRRHDRSAEDEKWQMVDPLDEGGEVEIS